MKIERKIEGINRYPYRMVAQLIYKRKELKFIKSYIKLNMNVKDLLLTSFYYNFFTPYEQDNDLLVLIKSNEQFDFDIPQQNIKCNYKKRENCNRCLYCLKKLGKMNENKLDKNYVIELHSKESISVFKYLYYIYVLKLFYKNFDEINLITFFSGFCKSAFFPVFKIYTKSNDEIEKEYIRKFLNNSNFLNIINGENYKTFIDYLRNKIDDYNLDLHIKNKILLMIDTVNNVSHIIQDKYDRFVIHNENYKELQKIVKTII